MYYHNSEFTTQAFNQTYKEYHFTMKKNQFNFCLVEYEMFQEQPSRDWHKQLEIQDWNVEEKQLQGRFGSHWFGGGRLR